MTLERLKKLFQPQIEFCELRGWTCESLFFMDYTDKVEVLKIRVSEIEQYVDKLSEDGTRFGQSLSDTNDILLMGWENVKSKKRQKAPIVPYFIRRRA